jgi:uncharacterized cupin superfamily protein
MRSKKLTVFTGAATAVAYDRPRPDRLVAGNPLRSTWNHYAEAGVAAGRWFCEPGAWRIAFADGKDEFFHVISGRLRITDADGQVSDFGPGDAGVIPGGFTGVFEVVDAVTKHYVLVERGAG